MYYLEVRTDIDVCDEKFVTSFLKNMCNSLKPELRPEKFGLGEPIRYSFDNRGLNFAIKMWLENNLPLMLKRVSTPKYVIDINAWQRKDDSNQFPSNCGVWLNSSAGDGLAKELFVFLIESFNSAFGFLSTEKDIKEKHFVSIKNDLGTITEFVGLDVGKKLPGIYWICYFNDWALKKIGKDKFNKINFYNIEELNNGFLVTLFPKSKSITSSMAKVFENKVKSKLGNEHFFDKTQFDSTKLLKI